MIGNLLWQARRGAGGVVLVDGEPGTGKSLLLQEAASQAAEQGISLATGAAARLGQAMPSFGLQAVRAQLEQQAAAAPVLVCLDDLHLASPATLTALRTWPGELGRLPIAWLLARSKASHRAADRLFEWLEQDGAARFSLAPLDHDAVAAMLADSFGAPPGHALADLACGAAGNPALVAELIGGLRDERAVRVVGGRAELTTAKLPQRLRHLAQRRLDGVSQQARHLLVTAAVLGPAFRLEDAAELLDETPVRLLPAIEETMDAAIMTAGEQAFTFRQELLRRSVGELIPRPARRAMHRQYGELLLARGQSADQTAAHLLQAAQPGEPASWATLDTAAARTLGSAPQSAAELALRALELTPPGDPAALPRAVAAAEALAAAGRLGPAARVARDLLGRPLPPVAEDRLRCVLASVLCARGQAEDAADQAQLVLDRPPGPGWGEGAGPGGEERGDPGWEERAGPGGLCDRALAAQLQALIGLRDELAGAVAGTVLAAPGRHDRPVITAALVARAAVRWDEGRVSDGIGLLRDAARYEPAISPDARQLQPLLALAGALVDLRQAGETEGLFRAADVPALRGIPAQAALALLRARAAMAAGRLTDAVGQAQAALEVALALDADGYAATAHCVLSLIELRRGDIAAAARHLARRPGPGPGSDRGAGPGPQFADLYARTETTLAETQLTEARDGPAAVLGRLRQLGADLAARRGLLAADPTAAAWLTRTALAAGDRELAARVSRIAQDLADTNPRFPVLAVAAAHSRGLTRQDPAALAQAATQHPDPWARASAAEDLGVLHAGHGQRDQAIRSLKDALGRYGQAGAARDQARVRRRLRQLGSRGRHWSTDPDRPVTGWPSLTGTEQAVAGHVAQGLNNSQVAARMYISPHTVAHHLRQAFRKLGISSRVELTRIVVEQARDSA